LSLSEGRPVKKRRRLFALTLVALLVALSVSGVSLWWLGTHPSQGTPSVIVTDQAAISTNTIKSCLSQTTCTTLGIATHTYDTVVLMVEAVSTTAPSGESGTPALTWVLIAHVSHATTPLVESYIYSVDNITGQASQTATVTFAAGTIYAIQLMDVSSAYTVSKDAAGAGSVANSTAISTTVTTVKTNDLVLLATGGNKNTTLALNGDSLLSKTNVGAFTAGALYAVDASTGSYTITGTLGTKSEWAGIALAIRYAGVPAAPTSLASGTVTTTTVPLTWTRASGPASNFTVYQAAYSGGSCGSYSTKYSAGITSASYTVTGLTQSAVYCFEVTQWNTTGESAKSTALTAVQTLGPPQAPTGLSVAPEPGTVTDLQISWTLPPGTVVNVTAYYKAGAVCTGALTALSLGVESGDEIGGLSSGTQYSVTVQAWNATGASPDSTCVSGTTYALAGQVTGLGYTGATTTTVSLTWTNPGGATVINDTVYVSTICGSASATQLSTGGASGTDTVTSLSAYTKYCFWVAAWSAGGKGTNSSYLNVTTLATPPGVPTSLQVTGTTTATISVSWTNPSVAAGSLQNLTVLVGTTCGTWTSKLSTGAVVTSYTIISLSSGTTYCISVEAWSQGGVGPSSSTVNGTTQTSVPTAPTSLAETSSSRTSITVGWTNPGGTLVNDTIYYKASSSCGAGMTGVSIGVATSYDIPSLTAATQYSIEVTAWSSGGQSPDSGCIQYTTPGVAPPSPTELTLVAAGGTWITIQWLNPAGYQLFNDTVYVSGANGACGTWSESLSTHGVVQSYNITSLTPGDSYCIEVTAWDDQSPPSGPLQVSTTPIGSVGSGVSAPPDPILQTVNPTNIVSNAPSTIFWIGMAVGLSGAILLFFFRHWASFVLIGAGVVLVTTALIWPGLL